jgi:hypothetical protein
MAVDLYPKIILRYNEFGLSVADVKFSLIFAHIYVERCCKSVTRRTNTSSLEIIDLKYILNFIKR